VSTDAPVTRPLARAALGLGAFTIAYNVVEGVVAVIAGLAAGAVSLIGFGLDSGIEVLSAIVVVVRLSAAVKRRVGLRMGSALVVADAAETRLCAVLSVTTFIALLAYLLLGWTWLDPVAGFVIAVFAVLEGREAWEGELVEEHGD
jgi:hypothetical protein